MKFYFLLLLMSVPGLVFSQSQLSSGKMREDAEKEIKGFVTYVNLTYYSYQQEYVNFLERKNCMIPENYGGYNIFKEMSTSLHDDFTYFSREAFGKYSANAADSLTVDSLVNEIKTVWIPNFQTVLKVIEALNERKRASIQSLSIQEKNRLMQLSQKNYKKFLIKLKDKWTADSRKFNKYNMRYNYFAAYMNMCTRI